MAKKPQTFDELVRRILEMIKKVQSHRTDILPTEKVFKVPFNPGTNELSDENVDKNDPAPRVSVTTQLSTEAGVIVGVCAYVCTDHDVNEYFRGWHIKSSSVQVINDCDDVISTHHIDELPALVEQGLQDIWLGLCESIKNEVEHHSDAVAYHGRGLYTARSALERFEAASEGD